MKYLIRLSLNIHSQIMLEGVERREDINVRVVAISYGRATRAQCRSHSSRQRCTGELREPLYRLMLTMNDSSVTIYDLNGNEKVLRANENAIYNYKNNYSKIDAKSGILQYPCEFLSESIEYNKAGDDCVRYVFTVLNSIDSQFVERIAKSSRKMWSQINTRLIYSDKNHFVEAMFKNGFNIFDSKELIPEKKIDRIDNNFKLEKGDIICRDGHIHIYVGNDGNDNFGWGKVNRKYPAKYNFSVERIGSEYRIKMDKGNDIEYYERVYRYRGGK